ncbi:MAG: hypothetical protein ABGY75_15535 [Gemmataceae bacterium]
MKLRLNSCVALWLLAACGVSALADPPKEQPAAKEKASRPTTNEEFAALAKEGPRPPWMPFSGVGHKMVTGEIIHGTVVEVSADAVEIRPKGKKETVKFPPHALLATGAVCHWETDCDCYLLDDVQKGDLVILRVGKVDKVKGAECFHIRIHERPGGVVPPSRKPSDTNPYHLQREYELFWERQGLKTPEELKTLADKMKFRAERGQLPPLPPVWNPPEKKDDKKKDDKK